MQDKKLLFTMASYIFVVLIYLNLISLRSSILGIAVSIPYLVINGMFLGSAFFENEIALFRFALGTLLLILLLGFVGWLSVIIYNLGLTNFALVLFAVATMSSLSNRKVKGIE